MEEIDDVNRVLRNPPPRVDARRLLHTYCRAFYARLAIWFQSRSALYYYTVEQQPPDES